MRNIGLDQQEIYNRYRVVPEIHGKIALANHRLEKVLRSDFDLTDRAKLHEFALSYFFFALQRRGRWASRNRSPVPRTSCPGSTSRPTCARKRTS